MKDNGKVAEAFCSWFFIQSSVFVIHLFSVVLRSNP